MSAAPQFLTLAEHVAELIELLEELELAGPEGRAEYDYLIRQQLSGTKDKIDRVTAVLAELDARAEACSAEIERLQRRKAQALRNADRLKENVLEIMQRASLKKLEGHTSGFTLRAKAPGVEVIDAAAIPAEFIEIRETRSPMKRAINDALRQGAFVPGARLVQTLSLLRR